MAGLKERVDRVLEQEIDRKQFLQYSVTIFLAAFGVTGIIQSILTAETNNHNKKSDKAHVGYGASRFNQ